MPPALRAATWPVEIQLACGSGQPRLLSPQARTLMPATVVVLRTPTVKQRLVKSSRYQYAQRPAFYRSDARIMTLPFKPQKLVIEKHRKAPSSIDELDARRRWSMPRHGKYTQECVTKHGFSLYAWRIKASSCRCDASRRAAAAMPCIDGIVLKIARCEAPSAISLRQFEIVMPMNRRADNTKHRRTMFENDGYPGFLGTAKSLISDVPVGGELSSLADGIGGIIAKRRAPRIVSAIESYFL